LRRFSELISSLVLKYCHKLNRFSHLDDSTLYEKSTQCKVCANLEAVFLVASSWHPCKDVANMSQENRACQTRTLARMSQGYYAENGHVEFKLYCTWATRQLQ